MRRFRWLLASGYGILVLATALLPLMGGPRSYAPFSLLPTRQPLRINLAVAPDLGPWLTEAVRRFNATAPTSNGRPLQVDLQILATDDPFGQVIGTTALIPAHRVWLDRLKVRTPNVQFETTSSIARSPLVFVTWNERASFLFPNQRVDWSRLYGALADSTNDWQSLGGQEGWGRVKIGLPQASRSQSGLGTLALLLTAYKFEQGMSVSSFLSTPLNNWLRAFENGINGQSQATALDLARQMATPAVFDAIPVSEYVASSSGLIKRENITLIYPEPTVWSDFPFAVLTSNPDERAAALTVRDFLLTDAEQQAALQTGLRPAASSRIKVNTALPNNPFTASDSVLNQAEPGVFALPDIDIITSLLNRWEQIRP